MKKSKGFTLIELLTVIIIIGIFLLVIIPSVSTYVMDAKKSTYVNTARGYIKEVKNMISSRELTSMKRIDTTFYIPIQCIHKESGGDSPFGEWESAYVAVIYDDKEFKFFWTSNDDNDMGILLTPEEMLANERVVPEITGISTSVGIGGRSEILVVDEIDCTIENAISKPPITDIDPTEPLDEDDMNDLDIEDDALRPMYSVSPKGWAQKKTVTITYPGSSDKREYSLDGGITWQNYTKALTFNSNGYVIAKNTVGSNYINGNTQTVTQVDPTPPTEATFSYTVTSKSIKVVANGYDPESGVKYFQFSNDNGANWSAVQEGSTYSFTNLKSGTYKIKIRAINATYENHKLSGSYLESAMKEVKTTTINQPKYSVEPETNNWVQKKTVTITYDSGYKNEYSIDGGKTWVEYTKPLEFKNPGTVIARSHDEVNYVTSSSFSVTKVDSTKPTSATATATSTSSSITVTATGIDNESGISKYQFSKDNGSTWEAITSNNTYTFNNLPSGTYNIKVRVINGTYEEHGLSNNYLDSSTKAVATAAINMPTYSSTPSGWSKSKTVTITYPDVSTKLYSTDGGTTWKNYTTPVVFTANGTIIAKASDGTNTKQADSYQVTQIENTNPTLSISTTGGGTSATITLTAADSGGSGLYSSNDYRYCASTSSTSVTGCTWTAYTSGTAFTITGIGNKYIYVYPIRDNAGNINDSKENTTTAYVIGNVTLIDPVTNFPYTGSVQTYTVPATGTYKIELWGAQGGVGVFSPSKPGCAAGKGAYTSGTISLTAGEILYVHVGQKGKQGVINTTVAESYNGGGGGGEGGSDDGAGSGGGATDVRLSSGTWDNATGLRSRIMVAGGGGGGSCVEDSSFANTNTMNNRHAAGLKNDRIKVYCFNDRNSPQYAPEVSQTTGFAFGKGVTGGSNSNQDTHGQGGGGGGYWGGSGASDNGNTFYSYRSGGTGGSSYISGHTGCVAVVSASSNTAKSGCTTGTTDNACSVHYSGKTFTNTVMKSGKESMTSPTGSTETGHSGDGYGRITYIGA